MNSAKKRASKQCRKNELARNQINMINQSIIRMNVKEHLNRLQNETMDKSFNLLVNIPLMVVSDEYWKKTSQQKVPQFLEYILFKYEDFKRGILSLDDICEYLKTKCKITIQCTNINFTEKLFILMLGLPSMVLEEYYWPGSAKRRLPVYTDMVISRYEHLQEGLFDLLDVHEYLINELNIRFIKKEEKK